jgi:hypothetical protein
MSLQDAICQPISNFSRSPACHSFARQAAPPSSLSPSTTTTMGLHFSRIWERMFGKREMRILMVGLDAAGKVKIISISLLNHPLPSSNHSTFNYLEIISSHLSFLSSPLL